MARSPATHDPDCFCEPCEAAWEAAKRRAVRYALDLVDEQYRVAVSRRRWAEVRRLSGPLDLLGGPVEPTRRGRRKAERAFYIATGGFPVEHPFLANPPNPRHARHEATARGCLDCLADDLWVETFAARWSA